MISLLFSIGLAWAQVADLGNQKSSGNKLRDPIDQSLTIRKVSVLPLRDNNSGLYAEALTQKWADFIGANLRFDVLTSKAKSSLEDLEDQPTLALDILKAEKTDAVIAGRITRGPQGLNIKLEMFGMPNGEPLSLETSAEQNLFEMAEVERKLFQTTQQLIKRLPYHGLVLSRRGNQVTVNLGSSSGIRPGQELLVLQIFKVNRHPRFRFIVGTEQILLGKILVSKVEDFLSFGQIVSEREVGSVAVDSKVTTSELQKISPPVFDEMGKEISPAPQPVAFGDNPKEWKPMSRPTFGKFVMMLGMGSYAINNSLDVGSSQSSQSLVPSALVSGEMWLNPKWFLDARIRQTVFRIANSYPSGTSSPSRLSVSSNMMQFLGGYNFLIQDQFFGPKVSLSLGFSRSAMTVDDSQPTAYTSVAYGSTVLGISGSIPVLLESGRTLTIGGELLSHIKATASESPTTSGESSSSQIADFAAFGIYQWNERIGLRGQLSVDSLSTSLSGRGTRVDAASSISQTMTFIFGGIEYAF